MQISGIFSSYLPSLWYSAHEFLQPQPPCSPTFVYQLSEAAVLYLDSLSVFSGLECVPNLRES